MQRKPMFKQKTIEIYTKIKNGQSMRKTAQEYGLTFTRVNYIYHLLSYRFDGIELPQSMKRLAEKKKQLQREYMKRRKEKMKIN